MNTEQILLLVAILSLVTAGLTLGKSYLEYETVRIKRELQKKMPALAKKKEKKDDMSRHHKQRLFMLLFPDNGDDNGC